MYQRENSASGSALGCMSELNHGVSGRHRQSTRAVCPRRRPRVTSTLPTAAKVGRREPVTPPAPARAIPCPFSISWPPPSPTAQPPSSRSAEQFRRRLACTASHHHRLHLAHSCAAPPSTTTMCRLLLLRLGEGVFPFFPLAGTSAAMAASMASSPLFGSRAFPF